MAHPQATRAEVAEALRNEERRAVREVLEGVAERGERITYSDLAERVDERVPGAGLYATNKRLWHLLSEIDREDARAGRPLLTVVVGHKEGDRLPGPGFFKVARDTGRMRPGQSEEDFAAKETAELRGMPKPR